MLFIGFVMQTNSNDKEKVLIYTDFMLKLY